MIAVATADPIAIMIASRSVIGGTRLLAIVLHAERDQHVDDRPLVGHELLVHAEVRITQQAVFNPQLLKLIAALKCELVCPLAP